MITITKQNDGVLFTFQDSDKYLYGNGSILVPFNALSIVADESDNITLRKSASYDIFLSARYDSDFGYASKEEAVNALKEILYDEAGISEEEVQQMIDAATSGIPSSQVVEQLRTDVNAVSGEVYDLQDDVASKADSSALTAVNNALTAHTANTTVHVTQAEKNTWNSKVDEGYVTDYAYSKNQIDGFLENATTLLQTISGEVDTKVDTTTYESGQYATAQALNALQENKLDASAYTPTDLSEYWTSAQTQSAIDAATSGIPSSQVIEALRSDLNTVSGEVENKQDALQFYGEGTEQWEEEDGDVPDSTAVFTQKHSDIYIEDSGDEGNSQAGVQTRVDTVKFNGVLDTGQSVSLVSIYANEMSNETTEYGSSIEVSDNGVGIKSSFIDYDDESSQRLASINMNHNDASISLESTVNENGTVMVINPSGVTINDERVLTESDLSSGYLIDLDTIMQRGLTDAEWDGTIEAVTNERPVYIKVDGYWCTLQSYYLNGNEMTLLAASDNFASIYTVTKLGSNQYSLSSADKQYVSQAEKDAWNAKVDTSAITSAITSASTNDEVAGAKAVYDAIQAGGGGGVTVDPTLDSGSTNPVANSAITNGFETYTVREDRDGGEVRYWSWKTPSHPYGGAGNTRIKNFSINGRCPLTQSNGTNSFIDKFYLVETSAITTSMTSSSTDAQVPSAKAVYDQLGGLKFVKLTQAAYDALATKDSSTLYIISD